MQLITYADRLAGDLKSLDLMLKNDFAGLFTGVHILPFFDPVDGADAGFDPIDHCCVDSRLGSWQDVKHVGKYHNVMADLIVNHVSVDSYQFKDVCSYGDRSQFWDLFLKKSEVFGQNHTEEQIDLIYRPRPTQPFSNKKLNNGKDYEFWTTFSADQVDINVESELGDTYLKNILSTFSENGVQEVRLDAAGYAIKRAGTRCFMLPETFKFIEKIDQYCQSLNMATLVEVHSHYQMQIEIAKNVSRVYDFALPPLILHAIYQGDAKPLVNWLNISPRNCVTVLDTHDGIGILDVAGDGDKPGLLNNQQIINLVEGIHKKSSGQSAHASGERASNLDIYQVNCTYYDALGREPGDYLIARAIQFFAPGAPQIYYVGLLAGHNDVELLKTTGVGRDINRHYFDEHEIALCLQKPVVKDLFRLIGLRNQCEAFNGEFSVKSDSESVLDMSWINKGDKASLFVDFKKRVASIVLEKNKQVEYFQISNGALSRCADSQTSCSI